MKYIILGSAGQLGSHLTNYLRSHGEKVIEFDIINSPEQDLRIENSVDSFINESDFVFFLAFDVGGSRYLKDYQYTFQFIDNNIRIMTNVFRSLKNSKKPFIFTSSQMSNMIWSSYGVLKSIGEHYCKSLNSPIVKFWNVYGIEHNVKKSHVITDFVKTAMKNQPIVMLTDGSEKRQFLYADDCSNALYKMSLNYDKLSRTEEYHITSFEWTSIFEVACIISEMTYKNKIIPSQKKDNIQKNYYNEPSKFIIESGLWEPKISLKEGIKNIIEYEKSIIKNF